MSVTGLLLIALLVAPFSASAHAQSSDALMWGRARTCADYLAFAANYPHSRYAPNAKTKIADMKCLETFAPPARSPVRPAAIDPCIQAREDWPTVEGATSLSLVRAYLSATPPACLVWVEKGSALLASLEGKARDAAAKQASIDAAARMEADRKADEQASAAARTAAEEKKQADLVSAARTRSQTLSAAALATGIAGEWCRTVDKVIFRRTITISDGRLQDTIFRNGIKSDQDYAMLIKEVSGPRSFKAVMDHWFAIRWNPDEIYEIDRQERLSGMWKRCT
jgi:hypothetical protein